MDIIADGQWIEAGHTATTEPARLDVAVVENEELVDIPSVQLTVTFGDAAVGTARSVEVYLIEQMAVALAEQLSGVASDARRIPDDDMTNDYSG